MRVNGVWNIGAMDNRYIVELVDGSLKTFHISPFKEIQESDLTEYKGYHPRKLKGSPMPDYLYRFYGLERNVESLSEVIRVRVSPSEKEKLEAYANNHEPETSVSELLREHIRNLIK